MIFELKEASMKRFFSLIAILIILLAVGQAFHLLPQGTFLDKYLNLRKSQSVQPQSSTEKQTVVYEESVITKVIENSLPSVVTIGISKTEQTAGSIQLNPSNPFGPPQKIPGQTQKIEQNIGSGFIISSDGLIITNRHVVADTGVTYNVVTNDKKKYSVEKIYRDPLNDVAILKISASGLKSLTLGDSSNLKLGQLVIAIGTPLGEFTNTVTNGIISGLGRGITAGSPFEGYVEKLDNVIQTNAAISPGNSGGPLLNSAGQAIGINTALAQGGQNIGFAIPINIVKDVVDTFRKNGSSFERPYIGVRYKMIDKQTAILNNIVEGAYVVEVLQNSPASKAGIQQEDVITSFEGQKITSVDNQELTKLISQKKIGDKAKLTVWRNGKTLDLTLTLEAFK